MISLMEHITLRLLDSTNEVEQWYVRNSYFIVLLQIIVQASNTTEDHHKVALHRSTRVGSLIVATIYLQLIQNRYMFRGFTVLQCSHQHCVQPVASDVEVVGYL